MVATIPVSVDTGFFGFVIAPAENLAGITFESRLKNTDPTVGQGFGLENIRGAFTASPTAVVPSSISVIASGLAYSRVTQTFNGTVTIKNVSGATITGPFQVVLRPLPSGVTMTNAWGTFKGNPYVIANTASLGPGQSVTLNVQFSNPSNSTITLTPIVYSGAL